MAHLHADDTIAAVATPPGEGGISVIRVSGPYAIESLSRVYQSMGSTSLENHKTHEARLGWIVDKSGGRIDQVIVTLFRAPNSYTGEDVAEISGHGGMKVTRKILEAVLETGVRMAEPGEFTKRAFLNGKMDLTQAEAVLDLIRAKSDLSVRAALKQLEGALSVKLREIKDLMMQVYAHMEAFLDFPEDDVEVYSNETFLILFERIESEMTKLAASFQRGSLMREGLTCVIAGKPNVGKSSLFNALLARDRALVSEHAGTTRDALEESVEIGGLALRLVDTAGLGHDSLHPLDKIGMERTLQALTASHLVLFVVDGSAPLDAVDEKIFHEATAQKPFLVLVNKSDKEKKLNPETLKGLTGIQEFIPVSAFSREGFDALEARLKNLIEDAGLSPEGEQITRLRHKKALESSLVSLGRAREAFRNKESLDFVALDLKVALDRLSELIGEIYSEDLLDVIFSEFCIGK